MPDSPIEYAMTHRVGATGLAERYQRPKHVLETAERMRRWVGSPELCQGCHTRQAVVVRGALLLCGQCRMESAARRGAEVDAVGIRARADQPADEPNDLELRGLSIVFNSPSVDLGFVEFIRPSAADRTFAENIDVRALWSHNPDITIGRLSAGTLRLMKVTRGVAAEIDPPRWASSHIETVKRRDVTGQSFAFQTVTDEWHLEDGEPVREVLDMRYFEVSGVAFPAYTATTLKVVRADARSWHFDQQAQERLRMAR